MNRNEINSNATIHAISEAFFERLARNGLENINIIDICGDCHISRTTFYRYFTDKFDVLEKKETALLDGTKCFSQGEISLDEFTAALGFIRENMFYYRIILASDLSRRFMVKWSSQINEGFLNRMGGESRVPEIRLRISSGGFLAGLSWWIEKEPELSVSEAVDYLYTLLEQKKPRGL